MFSIFKTYRDSNGCGYLALYSSAVNTLNWALTTAKNLSIPSEGGRAEVRDSYDHVIAIFVTVRRTTPTNRSRVGRESGRLPQVRQQGIQIAGFGRR
jgi:hypothetical protein